jgi:predicted dehydrogenase
MPGPIKVGVITQAEGAHLPDYFGALALSDDVSAVALADASGTIEAVARKGAGAKLQATYRDAASLLSDFRPQMVIVSLESALAPPAIDAALDANCHVVAEKPSCVRAEDMERLARKAQSKHRHLMLAMPNRLHTPVVEARRLVRSGKLGKVYGLEAHLVADQTRLTDPVWRKGWLASKARAGGGTLAWLGILWLDTALYIADQTASQVTGFAGLVGGQPVDIEDSAVVAMRLKNGSFGTLTAGYYHQAGTRSHIQVWGEHGWLRLAAVEEEPMEWYSTKDTREPKIERFEYPKGGRGFVKFIAAAVRASADMSVAPPIATEETVQIVKTVYAFYAAAESGRVQNV